MSKKSIFTKEIAEKISRECKISIDRILSALNLLIPSAKIQNLEQARHVYYYRIPRGSKEQATALKKWRKFSAKEVKRAQNLEQAKNAYYRAPRESKEQATAIRKIASFYL